MTDFTLRLSAHFTLGELCKSATADRLGIANVPGEAEVRALSFVCETILEPVRVHFGRPFSPNSGFRCLELNRAIKSKDTSQHVKGQAVDIEIPAIPNAELAEWIADNLEFDQLILEFYTPGVPSSGWVHVSAKPQGNRREILTIGKTAAGESFTRYGIVA